MFRAILLAFASTGFLLVGDDPKSSVPTSAPPSCCTEAPSRAKCVGADPCRACKNCKYCAYCRSGKTCGVCKPKPK